MKTWFMSLNGAIIFLDTMFVAEFRNMLPQKDPANIALMMLVYMVFAGVRIWPLLAAPRGSRRGLTTGLLCRLFTALGGGLITLAALCPIGCSTPPVGDAVVWANLIFGLAASIALGFHLTRSPASVRATQNIAGGETP